MALLQAIGVEGMKPKDVESTRESLKRVGYLVRFLGSKEHADQYLYWLSSGFEPWDMKVDGMGPHAGIIRTNRFKKLTVVFPIRDMVVMVTGVWEPLLREMAIALARELRTLTVEGEE